MSGRSTPKIARSLASGPTLYRVAVLGNLHEAAASHTRRGRLVALVQRRWAIREGALVSVASLLAGMTLLLTAIAAVAFDWPSTPIAAFMLISSFVVVLVDLILVGGQQVRRRRQYLRHHSTHDVEAEMLQLKSILVERLSPLNVTADSVALENGRLTFSLKSGNSAKAAGAAVAPGFAFIEFDDGYWFATEDAEWLTPSEATDRVVRAFIAYQAGAYTDRARPFRGHTRILHGVSPIRPHWHGRRTQQPSL